MSLDKEECKTNYFIVIRKLTFFNNKNSNFAKYNNVVSCGNAYKNKWQKITGNPINTEHTNNKNNNDLNQNDLRSDDRCNKLQQDFITKLRRNQIEYQTKQQEIEKQQHQKQQQQHQFNKQPIGALHDDPSPFVQHNQCQYSDDQNHKKNNNLNNHNNNNNQNNINDCYIYNGRLINISHDVKDDDYDDDHSRHSFYDYYNSVQEDKKQEKGLEGSSNKLLVTFDYGFSNSIEQQQQQLSDEFKQDIDECDYLKNAIKAGSSTIDGGEEVSQVWTICNPFQIKSDAAQFPVHRMRHNIKDNEISFLSTLIEYDVDDDENEEEDNDDDKCEEMLPLADSKIKLFNHNYGHHYLIDDNFANKRQVKIEVDVGEGDDYEEDEFYDSLESAIYSRFARA